MQAAAISPPSATSETLLTGPPVESGCPKTHTRNRQVARTSPGEFFRQVRAETAKVVWPTRKETLTTAVMVVIMTTLLGIFFFGVDSAFSAIVKFLLSFLG